MDLRVVSSITDDVNWYQSQLISKLNKFDESLVTTDIWTHSLVSDVKLLTNEHFGKRTKLDFSTTPDLLKLELKWHQAQILSDDRYNSRSQVERRRQPMIWFALHGAELLNHFSKSCLADIYHPSFPFEGSTKANGTVAHNQELVELYKNHNSTPTNEKLNRAYIKNGELQQKNYNSPRATVAGDIHKKIVITREQFKALPHRNIVLLNDLYSEDDYRFTDKQRTSDDLINFYKFPEWMRDPVRKHVYLKIEYGELAPSTLYNYFNRLTKFRDFMYESFEHPAPELISTKLLEDNYIAWGNEKGYTGKNWFTDTIAFLNTASKYFPDKWPSLSVTSRSSGKIKKVHYKKGLGRIGHNTESSEKCYSQTEIDQLSNTARNCPHPVNEIFTLILATGIRREDGHAMLFDCLQQDPIDSDFMLLTFWQNKVRKWNVKPLLKKDASHTLLIELIERQRLWILGKFQKPTKYLFPQFSGTKESFISENYTSNEIKLECVKNGIQRDDGTPLSFRWHALRHTKGTSMANEGHDILSIMMELGHTSPDMATVYVNNRLELKKKALMSHGSGRFFTIEGKVDDRVKELLVRKDEIKATRVCGGACSMPTQIGDWCSHANACYSCKYFRADEKDVEFFRREKIEINAVIETQENEIIDLAKNGQIRMSQITTKRLKKNKLVFKSLDTIINAIDEEGAYSGTESNTARTELND